MSKGIVVEHKGNGNRYATSEGNFNPETEKRIRELKPHESVRSYAHRPKPKTATTNTPVPAVKTSEKDK